MTSLDLVPFSEDRGRLSQSLDMPLPLLHGFLEPGPLTQGPVESLEGGDHTLERGASQSHFFFNIFLKSIFSWTPGQRKGQGQTGEFGPFLGQEDWTGSPSVTSKDTV